MLFLKKEEALSSASPRGEALPLFFYLFFFFFFLSLFLLYFISQKGF